jgi:hypothetical protein
LSEKDRLLQEYKNYSIKGEETTRVRLIEQELEAVMKQKIELTRNYEQKLLDKDKKLQQLQSQVAQQEI